ncbi:MAG: alanine/glycine:cation symporter family protein, partial [Halieaceae bacterium]|nr:alanine/glycine:cation symporter family protein [Halieaceae bacterium]
LVGSVAGLVGSGNIAGVAVAISLGGPGAIFWMWIVGLVGMSTSLLECSLAQLYKRRTAEGSYRGGPAYYIRYGLGKNRLALLYSLLLLVTFGLGFNAVQSFVVASSVEASFGLPAWLSGTILALLLGATIRGGMQRIASVAELLVPFMAAAYLATAIVVILININEIPQVFQTIFKSAFGFGPALGGGIGGAIMLGVKRGLFSNEAGLGSAPNVAATAKVAHPMDQGLAQALSVFIDTILLCSCTALMILLAGVYQPGPEALNGIVLTQLALVEHLGQWGDEFVSLALVLFAFSSILYNYYLGENSLSYLSDDNRTLLDVFRLLVLGLVLWGALQDLSTVFAFADLTMGLLGLVNLLAIGLLYRTGLRLLRDYDGQMAAGEIPRLKVTDYQDLALDHGAWEEEPPT